MLDATRTTTALLDGLHDDANAAAWGTFDARYRPIIVGFARRLGLSEADAADAAQETLAQFLKEYRVGRYHRERGRLRSWLIGIARTRIAMMRRASAGRREARGESAIVDLSDEDAMTTIWEDERRSAMLREALEILRARGKSADKTIEAFELLVFKQQPPAGVAEALGMSVHDVYMAKGRVATRLRDILTDLDALYDGED